MGDVTTVSTVHDLPKDAHVVYHITDARNRRAILADGIQPSKSSEKWQRLNEFLELVATEDGISTKPSHRENCVFTHPRFADAADVASVDNNIVFAIDLRQVDAPTYRASYHTATELCDILDKKSHSDPRSILDVRQFDGLAQDAYEKACEYWASLSTCSESVTRGGEVLIDGHVPPTAITHVTE